MFLLIYTSWSTNISWRCTYIICHCIVHLFSFKLCFTTEYYKKKEILFLKKRQNRFFSQRNMSFSWIFIKMTMTIITLNIIRWNLCWHLFGYWTTGFNSLGYLSCLTNCTNKFIMTFTPIILFCLLFIWFRFYTLNIKLRFILF